jgi:serine/threonine protein kinase
MEPGMSRVSDAALGNLRALVSDGALDAGRYALEEVLGEGGMGTVYRARDAELDREVAVKVLRFPGNPDWVERFRQEARTIAGLEHPGIVPVHDAGILPDGRAFYVMTLVRGQRLDAHLALLPSLAERLRLFRRVTEPLAFAHSRGVVHRDLKPANIMVGPFGEVLVMDWGLAQLPGSGPEPGVVLGTAGFMAPEQARGDGSGVDGRTDVYALGAILAGLLSVGRPDPRALRALQAIAARAMAPAAGDRYPGVAELSTDVGRFLDGEPVEAYPESLRDRLVRLASRYRTPLVLILAYLAMRLLLLLIERV